MKRSLGMTVSYATAILVALGAYAGTLFAFKHVRPRAPDATAQAYRDMIAALSDMEKAYTDIDLARRTGETPSEDLFAARNRTSIAVHRIARSASFLFEQGDLELIDEVISNYGFHPDSDVIQYIEKAIDGLRKSAHRTFQRGR